MAGQRDEISTDTAIQTLPGHERRATLRALKIWNAGRQDNNMPYLSDLTASANLAEEHEVFAENQFLILFEAATSNSVVIFYGSELPNLLFRRNVGNNLQQNLPAALKGIFFSACMEAVNTGEAVYRHGKISTSFGGGVLYRSIFMPLRSGNHSDRIYIFGAFSNEEGGGELLAAA